MLTQTDYVIISLLNTAIEKKNKAWKTECQKTDEWLRILWEAINTDPGVSRTFSRIFLNKTTQNTLVMLYRKFLRKKKKQLSDVLSEFVIFLKLGLL